MLLDRKMLCEDKNITFSSIKSDKFKASVIAFSINIPLTPEGVACNLLLSGLLRRGTHKYPSMSSLNRSLDELYGSYVEIRSSHVGNNLSLVITTEILDNKYIPDGTDTIGGVIDIVSDVILDPLVKASDFDRQIFEQELKIAIDAINSEKNNTRAYSVKRCAELMGDGISLYPAREQLLNILNATTLESVVEHYKNMISTSAMDIFYIGATEPNIIQQKLTCALKDFPAKGPCKTAVPLVYRPTGFRSVTEKMSVSQGKLAMGFSTGVHISPDDDRYYAGLMLNEIFGGSPSSKLFLNVREKMSLCYYCSSTFSIYTGVMMVSSGIEVDRLETVKAAILDQLEQIKLGNVTAHELEAARSSIINSYRQLYDSPFDMQSFYSGRAMFGVDETIEDCGKKLMAVTLEDIVSVAKEVNLDAVFFVEGTSISEESEDFDND